MPAHALSSHRDQPDPSRPRLRRGLMSSAAVAVAVLAAGCGSSGEVAGAADESRSDRSNQAGSDGDAQADPNFAGETSQSVDADLDAGPDGDDGVLLAPGVELRLTELGTVDTLPTKVYKDVARGASVSNSDSGAKPDEVAPADGQQFLVAEFESDDPHWAPDTGDVPRTTATLQLRGNEEANLFTTGDGTMQGGTVVASVPEDADPADATIRIDTKEQTQTLSLLDGKRRDTDVPQVYEAGTEIELDDVKKVKGTIEGSREDYRVEGEITEAFITPYLDDDHGGDGWATSGKVYVSLEVDWEMTARGASSDHSTIQLKLPNDSTESLVNDPSSLTDRFDKNAVFEIPADTEKATAALTAKVAVGVSQDAEEYGKGSAELKIS